MTDELQHKIHEGLLPLATPMETLTTLNQNPNLGDVDSVARSFHRFGQRKPIVAKKDGEVIAGNTSMAAMKQLGWTHCAVVFVEETEAESKAFALADNRTSELSQTDTYNLATFIEEIQAEDPALLEAASYSFTDIEDILNNALDEIDYALEDDVFNTTGEDDKGHDGFSVVVVLETEIDREEFLILIRDQGYKAFPKG